MPGSGEGPSESASLFDKILPWRSSEQTAGTQALAGAVVIDGLLWKGIETQSPSAETQTADVDVEGPYCPSCGDVGPVGITESDLWSIIDDRDEKQTNALNLPNSSTVEFVVSNDISVTDLIRDIFTASVNVPVFRCGLCNYETTSPALSSRDYELDIQTGEVDPSDLNLATVFSREFQNLRTQLDAAGDRTHIWSQWVNKATRDGPYTRTQIDGIDEQQLNQITNDVSTDSFNDVVNDGELDRWESIIAGELDESLFPGTLHERLDAVTTMVQAVCDRAGSLATAQLDRDYREALRHDVSTLIGVVDGITRDLTDESASSANVNRIVLLQHRLALLQAFIDAREDTHRVLHGDSDSTGVSATIQELQAWKREYADKFKDFLTLEETLDKKQTIEEVRIRLSSRQAKHHAFMTDALERQYQKPLTELNRIKEWLNDRESYNSTWVTRKINEYEAELNGFFDDDNKALTQDQLKAIVRNDTLNRVNAAAGTGKTTTFGRRVHFLLEEYDELSAEDVLAVTFTRNGQKEMETELSDTFGITNVDVRTLNSYTKEVVETNRDELQLVVGEGKTSEVAAIWQQVTQSDEFRNVYEQFMAAWENEHYDPTDHQERDAVVENLEGGASTPLGESIDVPSREEIRMHNRIATCLIRSDLQYHYQRYADWANRAGDDEATMFDFHVADPEVEGYVFIQYWPSESVREKYETSNFHSLGAVPAVLQRRADTASESAGTPVEVIIIEPNESVDSIKEKLNGVLRRDAGDVHERWKDDEAYRDEVYRRFTCQQEVVDKVDRFVEHARTREIDPESIESFLQKRGINNASRGVQAFNTLCCHVYRGFMDRFDGEPIADFTTTERLTKDMLANDQVPQQYTYQHILVDEMQDLNGLQIELIRELASIRNDVRVFGVGDDWQSIFGFRGARPDLFIEFSELYPGDGDPEFTDTSIETNHRCPDTVVDSSNELIRHNEVQTKKDPDARKTGGVPIEIHWLPADSGYAYEVNKTMVSKVQELVKESPFPANETRVVLRLGNADPIFTNWLENRLPNGVTIQTAHNSKGSESQHVILPKVTAQGGYPNINEDKWLHPIDKPPDIYEKHDADYLMEEERRIFYVAMTRAEAKLDIVTIEGGESPFVSELPTQFINDRRPLDEGTLEAAKHGKNVRDMVTGEVTSVRSPNGRAKSEEDAEFARLERSDAEPFDVYLGRAPTKICEVFLRVNGTGKQIRLGNCPVNYRNVGENEITGQQISKLQLVPDADTTIQ